MEREERMTWLAGVIAVLAIVYFMIISPGFRWVGISLLIMSTIGVYFFIQKEIEEPRRQRRIEEAQQQREALALLHCRRFGADGGIARKSS
jgi:EamA domain-containing membrane protein RarD